MVGELDFDLVKIAERVLLRGQNLIKKGFQGDLH
jgi:hypothetical protein